MADWISSAITGGAGLISGLFGPSAKKQDMYNAKSQQRQYDYQSALNAQAQKYNMETMAQENRYAVENWLMQQEYNSPENQLKRVQEAGLNPNLVMGQSNVTNASNSAPSTPSGNSPSGGSADAIPAELSRLNPIQRAFEGAVRGLQTSLQYQNISQDIRNKQANENLTYAQVDKTLQETLRAQEETLSYLLDNQKKKFENSVLERHWQYRIEQQKLDIKHTKEAIYNLHKQSNLHDTNADLNIARKKEVEQNVRNLEQNRKLTHVQTELEQWALSYRQKHNRLPSPNALQEEATSIFNAIFGTNRNRVNNNDERGIIGVLVDGVYNLFKD